MEEKLNLKQTLKELSVLVPVYGVFSVKSRMNKGDVPLFLRSDENLQSYEGGEHSFVKDCIFTGYQALITSSIAYNLFESYLG